MRNSQAQQRPLSTWKGDLLLGAGGTREFRNIHRLLPQRGKHQQAEGKAVSAAVDAVGEHSFVNDNTKAFQSPSEVSIGDVLRFAQVFDDGLSPKLEKLTLARLHRNSSLLMSEILKAFLKPSFIKFDECMKGVSTDAATGEQVLRGI